MSLLAAHAGMIASWKAWDPLQLAPDLLCDDKSTITLTAGTVSVWQDRSGNGYDPNNTSGSRPSVVSSAINGYSAIDFSSTFLAIPSGALGVTNAVSAYWMAAVFYLNSGTSERPIISHAVGGTGYSTRAGLFGARASSNYLCVGGRRLDSDSAGWANSSTSQTGRWVMALGVIDYSARTATLYIDGSSAATASSLWTAGGTTSATSSANARIAGNNASSTASTYFDGRIVAVSSGKTIDAVGIDKWFGYYANRYGLTANLPSGHPYKTSPP